jgi:hypothetical protein
MCMCGPIYIYKMPFKCFRLFTVLYIVETHRNCVILEMGPSALVGTGVICDDWGLIFEALGK